MLYAKFEVLETPDTSELHKYLQSIASEIKFESTFEVESDFVKVFFETQRDAKEYLRRVISDYATLGFEVEQEVDLFDLSVYVNDPELQAFFTTQRMNIQQVQTEALGEILGEAQSDVDRMNRAQEKTEASAVLNGLNNMRKIINVIVNRLDEKGIFLGEEINKVSSAETIH
jgi:hypothetical protein